MSASHSRDLNGFLLKVESIMIFVDCKVLLLLFVFGNLWRQTALYGDILGTKKVAVIDITNRIWELAGSDYLIWIPISILADIFIKNILRKYIYG
jgi:hypothetical protein